LQHARQAADFLQTRHHERLFTIEEAVQVLHEVIYHLESFDCALVRSAIPNYFLARLASKQVKVTLSGEGADELFAGYDYLKALSGEALQRELRFITRRLHNTNLQRCDRMSMAHGLEVRVPFLDDPDLVDYAFRLDPDLKIRGPQRIEKWILRRAATRLLPKDIVTRPKVKFAHGTGLGDHLGRFAEQTISDSVFAREREIAEGVFLRSKEELCYYRIFRQMFPAEQLWRLIGRSRSV
jgi:asparagine synthase (glutamine-hydrolysing)